MLHLLTAVINIAFGTEMFLISVEKTPEKGSGLLSRGKSLLALALLALVLLLPALELQFLVTPG